MKKFILTNNGKEVKIGDKLAMKQKFNTSYGEGYVLQEILVTKGVLHELIKEGIIKEICTQECTCKKCKSHSTPMDIEYYIEKIAEKMNWNTNKVYNYLNSINSILPSAALSIILREIAVELDKQYEDHIEQSPEIYVISLFDGRITKANKAHIKNYKNFAAFRTIEDAKIACKITRELLKEMFSSGK